MNYRESRARWRKSWRNEPAQRRASLSLEARGLICLLVKVAADDGCLSPVSPKGSEARLLAQFLAVRPEDRRRFYKYVQELREHGDDGEPLCLTVHDGHFYLTAFEITQARHWSGGVSTGRRPKCDQITSGLRSVLSSKPSESFNTETPKETEERRKKKEEDPPLPPHQGGEVGSFEREFSIRWTLKTGKPWSPGRPWIQALEDIKRQAEEHPKDSEYVLRQLLDNFFADETQAIYRYSPTSLAKQFDRFLEPSAKQQAEMAASRRVGLQRRDTDDFLEKCEEDRRNAYVPSPQELSALIQRSMGSLKDDVAASD